MKNQTKNQLDFKSKSITELNDSQQLGIKGGGETKVTFYFITIANEETVSLVIY